MIISNDAEAVLREIGSAYLASGTRNHKTMYFHQGNEGVGYDELYSVGMLKMYGTRGGGWMLTDAGQQWVMANCQDE